MLAMWSVFSNTHPETIAIEEELLMIFTSLGLLHRKNTFAKISTKWKTDAATGWSILQISLAPLRCVEPLWSAVCLVTHWLSVSVPHSQLHQYLLSLVKSESKFVILKAKQTLSCGKYTGDWDFFLQLAVKLQVVKIQQVLPILCEWLSMHTFHGATTIFRWIFE